MSKYFLTAILSFSTFSFAADFAPNLQWVKVAGNVGDTPVSAAAADAQGNLYITGATTAQDLTASGTAQRSSSDVYVMKLDPNGNVVYTTYIGGSGNDGANALALGPGGTVYLVGATQSNDFPVTAGTYLTQKPNPNTTAPTTFVLKLNASGASEWATFFPEMYAEAIAVDASGSPYIAGRSSGGTLPTTPGAYNTDFRQTSSSNGFFSVFGPLSAWVTKFNPTGTALVYSTYVPTDNQKKVVQEATSMLVDAAGNAWFGTGGGNTIAAAGPSPSVVELNPTGSAVVASASGANVGTVASLAFDADSNVYIAGSYMQASGFPATPGAFQYVPQPQVPVALGQPQSGGGQDAFVAKWSHDLSTLLAATLLGGEAVDAATSVAVDRSGNVIVGGFTGSYAFPTHAPFQTLFATRSGFAAAFDSNLTALSFSTYLGDSNPFTAQAVLPDGSGNILVAGNTLTTGNGRTGSAFGVGSFIVANKIALTPAPTPRLDSVQNYVSRLASPLAPGEPIIVTGAGFATDARILFNGVPLPNVAASPSFLAAIIPDTASTTLPHDIRVSNNGTINGTTSNRILVPAAAASPALYAPDGFSINGYARVLNADGTQNSPSNPAVPGSAITIFAAGVGQFTRVGAYAATALQPSVFIDYFYCNGIGATIESVPGLPGNVFKLSVYVPSYADLIRNNPDLKTYKFPAMASLRLVMGPGGVFAPMGSQPGVYIAIKP